VRGTDLGPPSTQPYHQRGVATEGPHLQDRRGLPAYLILCSRTSSARDAFRSTLHSTTTISVGVATDGTQLPDCTGPTKFFILCPRTSSKRGAFRSSLNSTTTVSVVVATEGPQLQGSTGMPNFLILCSRTRSSCDAFRSLLHIPNSRGRHPAEGTGKRSRNNWHRGAKEEHSTKLYVGKPTYTKVRLIRLRPLLHQTPKTLFYILGVD